MSFRLPNVRIGPPVNHQGLTLFPLFTEGNRPVDYLLSDEAIHMALVTVEEVSEGGSVPELLVRNEADARVLFLEGEELRGAKQNRVLNCSVLVPAKSHLRLPVSCVEKGRWRYSSSSFSSSDTMSSSKLRHVLKSSVMQSLKQDQGHRSDQTAVWHEVGRLQEKLGVASPTHALSDTFVLHTDTIVEYRKKLQYFEGCSGVAVAVGAKLASIDLFDKPDTCLKVWSRLLAGSALEAMEKKAEGNLAMEEVEETLRASAAAAWDEVKPIGEGQEFRAAFKGHVASALVCEGSRQKAFHVPCLVHFSIISGL